MDLIPYLAAYLGIAVFVAAVLGRILMFSRMPMHLRWELYPVPHESKRAAHGGSYLEESDWWLKEREVSHLAEFKAMATEIVFLEALHQHNRKLWWRSFPFHFGLYLAFAATVMMMAWGIAARFAPGLATLARPWQVVLTVVAVGGSALVVLGALGLLQRRLMDPDLADFTTASDIFNLLFFVVAFGCALGTFAAYDRDFALAGAFVGNLVTLNLVAVGQGPAQVMLGVTVLLLSILTAYIPMTHMSHFVAKYFAYHSIRWNDAPNLRGGPQEAAIAANLAQKVTWAAPHIQSDGKKNWVELATMEFKSYSEKK